MVITIKKWLSKHSILDIIIPNTLIIIIITIFPLILYKTMETLNLDGNNYFEPDIYYGSKALVLNILLVIMILLLLKNHHINKQLVSINTFFQLFLGWAAVSAIMAEHKMTAIFGWPFRWQGAFTYFMYFVVFIFTVKYIGIRNINVFLNFLFASAVLISVYGILQYYHIEPLKGVFIDYIRGDLVDRQVRSTIGNRNFLGSYLCLVSLSTSFCFLKNERRKENVIYFILSILFFAGVVVSLTRGVWLGFAGAFIMMLFLMRDKLKKILKKLVLLLVSFVLVIFILNWTGQGNVTNRINKTIAEVQMAQEGDVGNLGSSRMYIYQRAFEVFLQKPMFGTGPDCLGYYTMLSKEESLKYFGNDNTICIDKAHSEYLEYLVTMGLPGLVFYLLFIGSILVPAIKNRKQFEPSSWGILAGVIGYLLQATFNIGVISVLPIFFVYLAILQLVSKPSEDKLNEK